MCDKNDRLYFLPRRGRTRYFLYGVEDVVLRVGI